MRTTRIRTSPRSDLAGLEKDIESWIGERSQAGLELYREDHEGEEVVWVLKYFHPRYLEAFLRLGHVMVSTTPGYTWGDAAYVSPLRNPRASMMYGRAGVMGFIRSSDLGRTFFADNPYGLDLYKRWIPCQPRAYGLLSTTVHADFANRLLRNAFSRRFGLDMVVFHPDQANRDYVSITEDRWFAVYDWQGIDPAIGVARTRVASKIRNCRWVAIVGEDFEGAGDGIRFRNLFGHNSHRVVARVPFYQSAALVAELRNAYVGRGPGAAVVQVETA